MRSLWAMGVLGLAPALCACLRSQEPPDGRACRDDSHCAMGYHCERNDPDAELGLCSPPQCSEDAECGRLAICKDGKCKSVECTQYNETTCYPYSCDQGAHRCKRACGDAFDCRSPAECNEGYCSVLVPQVCTSFLDPVEPTPDNPAQGGASPSIVLPITNPCNGVQCGEIGGQFCGSCDGGQLCNELFQCQICGEMQCSNAAGSMCQPCAEGSQCVNDSCVRVAPPELPVVSTDDVDPSGSEPSTETSGADPSGSGQPGTTTDAASDPSTGSSSTSEPVGTEPVNTDATQPCTEVLSFGEMSVLPITQGPTLVTAADLNQDGETDLICARNEGTTLSVLFGAVGGGFEERSYEVGGSPFSAAIGDLDADGQPDLVLGSFNGSIGVLYAPGAEEPATEIFYPAGAVTSGVALFDAENDGDLDVAVANMSEPELFILLNDGSGVFDAPTPIELVPGAANAVSAGDLNGDGATDLVVGGNNSVSVLLNSGAGQFAPAVTYPQVGGVISVVLADLDGNGTLDVATSNWETLVVVLVNLGDGSLETVGEYTPSDNVRSIVAGDVNADGAIDLAVNGNYQGDAALLLNDGTGVFNQVLTIPGQDSPNSLTLVDLNHDALLDLVLGLNNTASVGILLNQQCPAGTEP